MAGAGPRFLTDTDYRRQSPEASSSAAPSSPSPAAVRRHVLDERKRSFLRMVSHELRTPLNSIIGFSEIIACELYGPINEPRYREHAEVVRESGQKLLSLVNQIVEIARLESGMGEMDIHPESAPAAAEEVALMLELEADERNIRIEVAAEPGLPAVLADARGLKTILRHLMQNALTYSPDGGVVAVSLRSRKGEVAIEVRDHGPGIAAKDVARLMRPFEQGEGALTRRSQGAGLGLPIVKLLCDSMGGRLRLQRARGGGLVVTAHLPAAKASQTDAA